MAVGEYLTGLDENDVRGFPWSNRAGCQILQVTMGPKFPAGDNLYSGFCAPEDNQPSQNLPCIGSAAYTDNFASWPSPAPGRRERDLLRRQRPLCPKRRRYCHLAKPGLDRRRQYFRKATSNMRTRTPTLGLLFAIVAIVSGCGGKDANRCTIGGDVMLDGNFVEAGSILLIPVDGAKGAATGGQIENGRYPDRRQGRRRGGLEPRRGPGGAQDRQDDRQRARRDRQNDRAANRGRRDAGRTPNRP